MEQRKSIALYGYSESNLRLIEAEIKLQISDAYNEIGSDFRTTLLILKNNLHWTTASVFLQINERSLREKVARFLGASESLKLDEMCRFAEGRHPGCWSQCTMLVDGFPVFKGQRKDGSNYSGKYKRAALKFECICSLSGVPLCIRGPFPGKQHDSAIFQSGNPLVHNPEELIIADKAYIGLPHCIVPQKKSKNIRPSKSLELWHRKYRAPVEHCFARFHKFRFMKYCYWSDALATKAVKFIAFCENACRKSSFSGEPIYPMCHCQFQRVEKVTRKRQREEETAAAESQ